MSGYYRIFPIDERRRIIGPPTDVECVDDPSALHRARQLSHDHAVEVWSKDRFIAIIPKDAN